MQKNTAVYWIAITLCIIILYPIFSVADSTHIVWQRTLQRDSLMAMPSERTAEIVCKGGTFIGRFHSVRLKELLPDSVLKLTPATKYVVEFTNTDGASEIVALREIITESQQIQPLILIQYNHVQASDSAIVYTDRSNKLKFEQARPVLDLVTTTKYDLRSCTVSSSRSKELRIAKMILMLPRDADSKRWITNVTSIRLLKLQ